jgi:hypothetical protein
MKLRSSTVLHDEAEQAPRRAEGRLEEGNRYGAVKLAYLALLGVGTLIAASGCDRVGRVPTPTGAANRWGGQTSAPADADPSVTTVSSDEGPAPGGDSSWDASGGPAPEFGQIKTLVCNELGVSVVDCQASAFEVKPIHCVANAPSAWVYVSKKGPPDCQMRDACFVMLWQDRRGWRSILQSTGEMITVMPEAHEGFPDLVVSGANTASEMHAILFAWSGVKYQAIAEENCPLAASRKSHVCASLDGPASRSVELM